MQPEGKKKRKTRAEVMLTKAVSSDSDVRAVVDSYVSGTIEQLGGLERIGAGARALVLLQKITLAVIMRVQKEIDLAALAEIPTDGFSRTLSRYLTVFRQNQVALGLARARARRGDAQTLDFAAILEEYSSRKKGA